MACNHNNINCGCKDNFLTTPPACPTPESCPDPQPCSEVFDAQCIIYSGADILCGDDTVVTQNQNISEALTGVVDYFCNTVVLENALKCPESPTDIAPAGTPITEALELLTTYMCTDLPITVVVGGDGITVTDNTVDNITTYTVSQDVGPVGISDSNGVYTYYSTLFAACAAATAGDVITLFADLTETGSVTCVLPADVTLNLNGYTYTLDTAGASNAIEITGITTNDGTPDIVNGTIIRKNGTYGDVDAVCVKIGITTSVSILNVTLTNYGDSAAISYLLDNNGQSLYLTGTKLRGIGANSFGISAVSTMAGGTLSIFDGEIFGSDIAIYGAGGAAVPQISIRNSVVLAVNTCVRFTAGAYIFDSYLRALSSSVTVDIQGDMYIYNSICEGNAGFGIMDGGPTVEIYNSIISSTLTNVVCPGLQSFKLSNSVLTSSGVNVDIRLSSGGPTESYITNCKMFGDTINIDLYSNNSVCTISNNTLITYDAAGINVLYSIVGYLVTKLYVTTNSMDNHISTSPNIDASVVATPVFYANNTFKKLGAGATVGVNVVQDNTGLTDANGNIQII